MKPLPSEFYVSPTLYKTDGQRYISVGSCYLSIQPVLINRLLFKKVENGILKQIEFAQFFSVIMNTTQEINRKDQLNQIIRCLKSEDEVGRPTNLKIIESFLG